MIDSIEGCKNCKHYERITGWGGWKSWCRNKSTGYAGMICAGTWGWHGDDHLEGVKACFNGQGYEAKDEKA